MKKIFRPWGYPIVAALLFLSGCYTVPETGRQSFIIMPVSQEMALGADAFQDIKAQEEISTDAEATARVERVGRRIAAEAAEDMPDLEWEFVLFEDDDMINAFALPGGKVGVYTGLLEVADTDDRLAAVMGHEIAHVTARHGAERMSRSLALAAVGVGIGVAASDSEYRDAIMIAYGLGATLGVDLPYSRKAESEADEVGLTYSARAGYDPREAVTFWERMSAAAASRPQLPSLLSTHPSDEKRIADLKELLPEAIEEYNQAQAQAQVN